MDISNFLLAEISAVEELLRREEERLSRKVRPADGRPKKGFADRILEEQREKILKYPELVFHPDAREEVRRLLGALVELERSQWLSLGMALQETAYSRSSLTMTSLEIQLRSLASLDSDGFPAALTRLMVHLNRFPRDYHAIDREEQEYILKSAFFLHELLEVMDRVDENYPDLGEQDRETLRVDPGAAAGNDRRFPAERVSRRGDDAFTSGPPRGLAADCIGSEERMGNEVNLTGASFQKEVLESPVPVLVDFWAEWCVPCKMVAPILDKLSQDNQGRIKVAKVNVDQEGDLASKYNIVSIPTLLLFEKGKVVKQQVGAVPRQVLDKMIGDYVQPKS